MRELEQTWTGHGKNNCFEAIRQANRWLHSNRPDKFYDTDYAKRSMHCRITDHNSMVHWWNYGEHDDICDFIDKLYEQINKMDEYDYYNIVVDFRKVV